MNDMELSNFVPKYGDRIALKNYLSLHNEGPQSFKKQKIIESLKLKFDGKMRSKFEIDDGKNLKKKKPEKQIFLGWLHCMDGTNYRQVKETGGGGTRKMLVLRTATKKTIIEKGLQLFFPKGESKHGKITDFEIDLFDFKHNTMCEGETVESIIEATGLTKLRFYLATKLKNMSEDKIEPDSYCSVSSDEDIQLKSYNLRNVAKNGVTKNDNIDSSTSMEYNDDFLIEFNNEESPQANISHNQQDAKGNDLVAATTEQPSTDVADEFTLLVNAILNESEQNNVYNNTDSDGVNVVNNTTSSIAIENTESYHSIGDILLDLQKLIVTEKISKFNIFREDIFDCCVRAMRRKTFSPFHKISVKFSDIEGSSEGAVDEGGPTREMFRLVINYIKDSPMFVGTGKKHITLCATSLHEKHYYEAGRLIALSLVHGGPAPHFFSDLLFDLLICNDNPSPTFEDVDDMVRNSLLTLQNTENLKEAQDVIISSDIFSSSGHNFLYKEENKDVVILDTLRFYSITRIQEVLQQFIEGLKICNIYDYIKTYPHFFKSYLCEKKTALTANDVEDLFFVKYSESGSNARNKENKSISFFRDYLMDCEAESDGNKTSLQDILIFATGADYIPPLGFPNKPSITFLHDIPSIYPMANTCALELKLPVVHTKYDDFKSACDFGIGNCQSFGFA